jgi:acetyl-CoA acetyltransferase
VTIDPGGATTLKDKTAIVGIGRTKYFKRGQSLPMTQMEMAIKATMAALEDAGLSKDEIDGFALYSAPIDPGAMAAQMGLENLRFSATLTSGGNGSAGSVGLAAAAVNAGLATHVVSLMTLQQASRRLGGSAVAPATPPADGAAAAPAIPAFMLSPTMAFNLPASIASPGHNFAMITNRHMHQYGTKREHFAEICISQRNNAIRRPTSLMREPLTLEDYFAARMISEPLCLFDYTPETDGAVAVITTSIERARDLKQPPAVIMGSANGGTGNHYSLLGSFQMPESSFASAGHRDVAKQVYAMAGVGPQDIDVALLYDHFSPMVLMQIEDYGFCGYGEGGPFVADGNIRWPTGTIPVNTHGGNLSEAYVIGMTHVYEAVEQVRGTAINQVEGCELALVTGGPASIPMSATILRKA